VSAAGWHDDPYHRFAQRYHDGTGWTGHVSDGSGVSFTDPSGASPYALGGMPVSPAGPAGDGQPAGSGRRAEIAGAWIRLLARIVDGIVLGIPLAIVSSALFGPAIELVDTSRSDTEFAVEIEYNAAALIFTVAISGLYDVLMLVRYGRTVGKMACGLTVVDDEGRGFPNVGSATVRWLSTYLYAIPLFGVVLFIITVVMIFAGARRQTIHDKLARTVVVKTSSL
jgi:uncharacterized RDD family membrane protein YckC